MKSVLWLDFETGGLEAEIHSPLSFAMIGTNEEGAIIGEWYTQLRFEPMIVTAGALAINKIDLREPGLLAKDFKNAYHAYVNQWFYGGSERGADGTLYARTKPNSQNMPLMGGHNVPFDKGFLQKWVGSGAKGDWTGCLSYTMDTLTLALIARELGYINPTNLKLGTVAECLGIKEEGELHNALVDLRTTIKVYQVLKELMKNGQRT